MDSLPRPRALALVVAATAALALAPGCTKNKTETSSTTSAPATTAAPTTKAPSNPSTTPTTASSDSTTSTKATATTTTTMPSDARGYAQALLDAWRRGDREAASPVATPEAIDQIFAHAPAEYSLEDCSGAAGSTICTFNGAGGQLTMQVRNLTGGLPMAVVAVQFI